MSLPDAYRLRPATVDHDLDAAVAILRECDLHDVGFDDVSEVWIKEDWTSSGHRGAWIVEDPDGRPCGFAGLGSTDPSSMIDSFLPVLPAHRDAVRPALLESIEREARSVAVGTPTLLASFSAEEGAAPVVEAAGFSFARVFWHMQRPIEASFQPIVSPPSVTIRPYVAGDDDRLGWQLIDQAFAGHFGMDPVSLEDYLHDVIESDSWTHRSPRSPSWRDARRDRDRLSVGTGRLDRRPRGDRGGARPWRRARAARARVRVARRPRRDEDPAQCR